MVPAFAFLSLIEKKLRASSVGSIGEPAGAVSKDSGKILIGGKNFGSGSSREHAAWAVYDYGFRAVVSSFFADIFKGNALKNSLLPIVVPADVHADLFRAIEADPEYRVTVDLATQTLRPPNGREVQFPIDGFSKQCLLEGVDELGYILQQEEAIARRVLDA